ncbi:ATP-binding response regulator [Marinobacter orientalis]|uniref:histidine kinase n=1 Tax=Marinobacter orientalis TaxID=1928859 RepID=A0A7Y0RBC4_9GAMM|nr:hybrid sensor histidine kinase/response regulator [Marinobacter orientalis]NMT63111.1 response regulator [Marinobacter orientalis]TGX51768.1 response regulator [Marinobacter orientalis]
MESTKIEQRTTFEALAPYFKQIREWAAFTILVPLSVMLVMWNQVDRAVLLSWLVLMLAGTGARYLVASGYRRNDVSFENAHLWHLRLLIVQAYMGFLWAIAVFLMHDLESPPHRVFAITLALILGIGSISAGAHWLPLYYSYGLPIKSALAAKFVLLGDVAWFAPAIMVVFAILASYGLARKLNSIVRWEIRLRLETADLADQLKEQSRELQNAIRTKSRTLATASHDFRQPLHALSLFVDALKGADSRREEKFIFSRIDASLDAMRRMFDALFDLSRLDANIVQPEPEDFDIETFLIQLKEEFQDKAGQRHVSLRLHTQPAVVRTDQVLLERVLRNLITNAIRYTDRGGILLSSRPRQDSVLVQVWDTGIGIPQEAHERIFIEFQQAHESPHEDERDKGLGFGLAIVHKLCSLMGLPLDLRSVDGRGSVFSLSIPTGDPARMKQSSGKAIEPEWQDSGHHILVIDNDENVLHAMDTLLNKWGFRVTPVTSPTEALKLLPDQPDLVLSDLSLDGPHNGIEAIQMIRERYGPELPAIIITGTTNPRQLQEVENSGLRMIQKPVRPSLLRSFIQRQLASPTGVD